jgi:hypothetical protein
MLNTDTSNNQSTSLQSISYLLQAIANLNHAIAKDCPLWGDDDLFIIKNATDELLYLASDRAMLMSKSLAGGRYE